MNHTKITDKYELYSYSIYLYLYALFYMFVFEQTFFNGLLINIFGNGLLYYFFNHNVFSLITHSYMKNHLLTIAMPQLLTCSTNILVTTKLHFFNNKNDLFIILPLNYLSYHFIKNMYKNEFSQSLNLRFILIMIFLFVRFIF